MVIVMVVMVMVMVVVMVVVAECSRLFSNLSQLKPLLHQQPNHVAIISLPLQHYTSVFL